jgi:alpha-ketoglutaric semialdehyde dehydrogenase
MSALTFQGKNPVTGENIGPSIAESTHADVTSAIARADSAKLVLAHSSPSSRSTLLRSIASAIDAAKEELIATAHLETALPIARLTGEVARTVIQIQAFATMVESGVHLDPVIDLADPNFAPVARPDLRKHNQSMGVVAVFAASNFPFAFSVLGGDSASALAAGCPVVVKAHPSHPHTSALTFEAVQKGITAAGFSSDIFSIAQGTNPEITGWLAKDPLVTAIGFTGSGLVGKLLLKFSQERPVPIPVFAEMGSLNPVFITTSALLKDVDALAKAAMDSAMLGSGQFCTKPGILIVPADEHGDAFIVEVEKYLAAISVAPLLNKAIATRFTTAIQELEKSSKIKAISGQESTQGFGVKPTVFVTDWKDIEEGLLEEHFGPTSVIIRAPYADFLDVAKSLEGQLTATIHTQSGDSVEPLVEQLTQLAGRVIWNGFPTAVSVTAAQHHGGQWPASSTQTTSVGLDAIYRFLRAVAFQNFPDAQLPPELQNANPLGIIRSVNGEKSSNAL